MKLILLLAVSCLALHNGTGAPRTAVYKFVRCNPEGDQSNCVTQQSQEMPWSPDLPSKLPASAADSLGAEPVEEEEETSMPFEKLELPGFLPEEGSGVYEGSGWDFVADKAVETGSGEQDISFFRSGEKPGETELKEDDLLQL
ncbi:serglycin [Mugil cephalus]|uniref:serglycin n=1 Tax=Mugil cephalus TaxID=48193 RepID=UPI001FB78A4F|nr:serglycin [Mugil cephalus]